MSETLLLVNGSRRRRRRSIRGFRRNPISRMLPGGVGALIGKAATGAVGALAVNAAVNHSPLPVSVTTGYAGYAMRGIVAALLGTMGRRLPVIGKYAHDMAVGSLTVTIADALRVTLAPMVPQVNLSGTGFYSPGFIANNRPQLEGANFADPSDTAAGMALSGSKVSPGKVGMYSRLRSV